jgi:hypothetical protein
MPGSCTLTLIYDAISDKGILSLGMVNWSHTGVARYANPQVILKNSNKEKFSGRVLLTISRRRPPI